MSELSPRTWARESLRFSQAGGTAGFPWWEEWPLVHAAASGRAARGRVGSVCRLAGEPESAVPLGDLPGAWRWSGFSSGLCRGLPVHLLESPHVQLAVQALTSRCGVDGGSRPQEFSG